MKWLAVLFIMTIAAAMDAAPPDPVRYIVRFPAPQTHYVSVEATIPTGGQSPVELFMPVWTPGSYLIREFARHVEAMTASGADGKALRFVKSTKNRWRVETGGAGQIHLAYRVYCHEMSVRTNWVEGGEAGFALLNGAATFITLAERMKRPHEVEVDLPAAWKTSITALPEAPGGGPHHYIAADYDRLVDSPIVAGNPAVYKFEVDGIPHYLVNQGEDGVWDGPRSAADVEKIVRQYRTMWGALPYRKYVFLNMITEARGGLEHSDSLCMMTSRWATRTRAGYADWLALVSHEFFHAWNIKRLRPVELGPFNYETENPTKSLWVSEGITDYYGPLTIHRAGLTTRHEYLGDTGEAARNSLSATINTLQTTPGRLLQSAEQASLDAWIKLYRPDENTNNSAISYYTKGAVVGWLLDARIRHATDGAKCLDDLMRVAFARYSGEHGFTPEQFKAAADEMAGASLREFFARSVESTEELDYSEAVEWFGLRFKLPAASVPRAWMGAETKIDNGRLLVSRVPTGTPAARSGLSVDDEIVAIGDFRVRPDQLAQRLTFYKSGDDISILVARRERLVRLDLVLGEQPPAKWQLEVRPDATPAQKQHLEAWLGK
ncbi:MAG: PDZ domain-containing protein [Acidobacteriota bacterium]|nr:PDZ domain-containing protein [Acidobacteriota bacterium]